MVFIEITGQLLSFRRSWKVIGGGVDVCQVTNMSNLNWSWVGLGFGYGNNFPKQNYSSNWPDSPAPAD